jgi:hypothetical protein
VQHSPRIPSVLVLVLAARGKPYPSLVATAKRTWASARVEGVEVLFYFGGGELRLHRRELSLPVDEDVAAVGYRTLAVFEYAMSTLSPAVVFRPNASSYVDLPNMAAYVRERVPATGFYGGRIGIHEGIRFASGSGYFLTRDLVELVLGRRDEWDHSLVDDVALGKLLGRHGIAPREVPRQDLMQTQNIEDLDLSGFHFRCKSGFGPIREDRLIMLEVHRAFGRARGMAPSTRLRLGAAVAATRLRHSLAWRLNGVSRRSPLRR